MAQLSRGAGAKKITKIQETSLNNTNSSSSLVRPLIKSVSGFHKHTDRTPESLQTLPTTSTSNRLQRPSSSNQMGIAKIRVTNIKLTKPSFTRINTNKNERPCDTSLLS